MVWIDFPGLKEMLDLGHRDPAGSGHHGIEILRRLAVYQVSPTVALPCLDQCEVRGHAALQHVRPAVELARLLTLGDNGAEARRRVEGRNSSAAGANAL